MFDLTNNFFCFRYIAYGDEKAETEEFELDEPLSYLKSASADDLGDIIADIKVIAHTVLH